MVVFLAVIPLELTHALLVFLSLLLRHSRLLFLTDLNARQGISDTSCFLAELKTLYSSDHKHPHTSQRKREKVGGCNITIIGLSISQYSIWIF